MAASLASSSARCALAAPSPSGRAVAHPRARVVARSGPQPFEKAAFGDNWGARDPTAGELASNFSDKVLGNWDTEHIIKPPDAIENHIGLLSRTCGPEGSALLDENVRERLRQQTPGWRVVESCSAAAGVPCIRQEWTARDADAAAQVLDRVRKVAEEAGHALAAADAVGAIAFVELASPAAGGLTENDFIVAARINKADVAADLVKRKARFWA